MKNDKMEEEKEKRGGGRRSKEIQGSMQFLGVIPENMRLKKPEVTTYTQTQNQHVNRLIRIASTLSEDHAEEGRK